MNRRMFTPHVLLCIALVVGALVLAVALSWTPLLLLPLACLAMLAAMFWMMRGGHGHGDG